MSNDTSIYRATRVVWYIFYILEALLLARFLLRLLGANPDAAFTALIYNLSAVPLAPFQYVFNPNYVGNNVFEWSTLLAVLVYWFVASAIVKLMSMGRTVNQYEAGRTLKAEETE